MEKPWDVLRESSKPPIKSGRWRTTTHVMAGVRVEVLGRTSAIIEINSQVFDFGGLRQLSELCTELADQLEGK